MRFVGGMLGVLVFCVVPKWRNSDESKRDTAGMAIGGAFFGALVVSVIPPFLGCVLPAPSKWFPQEIVNIAEASQAEALIKIEAIDGNTTAGGLSPINRFSHSQILDLFLLPENLAAVRDNPAGVMV